MLKMGTVALDGTKVHANASRHSALSYEYAGKIEEQLKAEVAELTAKAEAEDTADVPDGMFGIIKSVLRLASFHATSVTIANGAIGAFEFDI